MRAHKLNLSSNDNKLTALVVALSCIIIAGCLIVAFHTTRGSTKNISTTDASTIHQHSASYDRVQAWANKYGDFIQTIQKDNNDARNAVSAFDYASLNKACMQLATDVKTDLGYPAIPDPEAASHMSATLAYLSSYADSCIKASSDAQSGDVASINRANAEFESANSQLKNGVGEMGSLNLRLQAIKASN